MKKLLLTVSTGLAFGFSLLAAESLVSIDSIKIMQESQEGKTITEKIQKDVEKFQNQVRTAQTDLSKMQEELSVKAKVLSQDALQEKTEAITKKKKDVERDLADKEESLRANVQRHQMALREKQLKVIKEVSEKEKWGAVVDINTPGVLFVSNAIDRTDLVLKAVDAKYLASSVNVKPTATTLTTVKNDTKQEAKKDIKVA
jgi:Skp family chaperone for outer membrane proteins